MKMDIFILKEILEQKQTLVLNAGLQLMKYSAEWEKNGVCLGACHTILLDKSAQVLSPSDILLK